MEEKLRLEKGRGKGCTQDNNRKVSMSLCQGKHP